MSAEQKGRIHIAIRRMDKNATVLEGESGIACALREDVNWESDLRGMMCPVSLRAKNDVALAVMLGSIIHAIDKEAGVEIVLLGIGLAGKFRDGGSITLPRREGE